MHVFDLSDTILFFAFFHFVLNQWRQLRRFGIFIVNFERISHLVLVFLLLTLNR